MIAMWSLLCHCHCLRCTVLVAYHAAFTQRNNITAVRTHSADRFAVDVPVLSSLEPHFASLTLMHYNSRITKLCNAVCA